MNHEKSRQTYGNGGSGRLGAFNFWVFVGCDGSGINIVSNLVDIYIEGMGLYILLHPTLPLR
jgi:hypothetical protein